MSISWDGHQEQQQQMSEGVLEGEPLFPLPTGHLCVCIHTHTHTHTHTHIYIYIYIYIYIVYLYIYSALVY
jgi:hypothetical protein